MPQPTISVIVPTIGRPESLCALLESLCIQTERVQEVIVADGSNNDLTERVINDPKWASLGLVIKRVFVNPPNAVRQRQAAIAIASGTDFLLLDDDVVLEPDCVERMARVFRDHPDIAGVMADFNNLFWPMPTHLWRIYLNVFYGLRDGEWQGKVIGPLLRFGYNPRPNGLVPMDWLGTCSTMVRRSAYEKSGGFSNFFLHRCTMNEDVDLGLKISRIGRLVLCPAARLAHYHAPSGRVSPTVAAEDDVYNRFMILHKTMGCSKFKSFMLVFCFVSIECLSNFLGSLKRRSLGISGKLLHGRIRGIIQAGRTCLTTRAEDAI